MAQESKRGCGYRKVGGIYLVGGSEAVSCDRMPFRLDKCPLCGAGINQTRGLTWLPKELISELAGGDCVKSSPCHAGDCPVCRPSHLDPPYTGLLWVGSKFYTPEEFMREAGLMGVCKRIATIPKKLVIGKTWVLLAHPKVKFTPTAGVVFHEPAIFTAFKPSAVEMLLWDSMKKPELTEKLAKRGITPVWVKDGDADHAPDKPFRDIWNDPDPTNAVNKVETPEEAEVE
jgi:hypothetical protein